MARARARQRRPDGLEAGVQAPDGRRTGVREAISFAGWHLLMLVWLLSWLLGAWWVWPVLAQLELNSELLSAVFWLVTGGIAWVVAVMLGLRRYYAR
jgi:hypothetical protein